MAHKKKEKGGGGGATYSAKGGHGEGNLLGGVGMHGAKVVTWHRRSSKLG